MFLSVDLLVQFDVFHILSISSINYTVPLTSEFTTTENLWLSCRWILLRDIIVCTMVYFCWWQLAKILSMILHQPGWNYPVKMHWYA